MKRYRTIVFSSLFLFFAAFFLSAENSEVIGLVVSVNGDFKHHYTEKGQHLTEQLKPGAIIYRNSTVTPVSGRGSFFQIGTQTDLVKIGSFPDSSFTPSSPALSDEKQNLYFSAIGGHALHGNSINSALTNFHKLFIDPIEFYSIDINDLREGFTLIFSSTKNSMINGSLNPLYLQLRDDKTISSIEYVFNDGFNEIERGNFTSEEGDWRYTFDKYGSGFGYERNRRYDLRIKITYQNGTVTHWNLGFYVFDEYQKKRLLTEVKNTMEGRGSSELEINLAIAAGFQRNGVRLTAWKILSEWGIDFRNMIKP